MSELERNAIVVAAERATWVEAVLAREIPTLAITKAIYTGMQGGGREVRKPEELVRADARRAELMALPEPELRALYEQHVRRKQEEDAARAAAAEAALFYNAPGSRADFGYWLAMDSWSIDEAVALALGRDPRVVSWDAIRRELEPKGLIFKTKPPLTRFLKVYLDLRTLAHGSDVMTASARVRPRDAARWLRQRVGLQLPEKLRHLVGSEEPQESAVADDPATKTSHRPETSPPTLVKRAALRKLRPRWPTVENDLNHADRNGLRDAAKAPEHGMWREEDALEWARREGKLVDASAPHFHSVAQGRPTHRG